MKTLKGLKDERAALQGEGRDILAAADALKAAPTTEQNTRLDAIEKRLNAIDGEIAAAEAEAERRRRFAGDTIVPAAAATPRIDVGRDRAALDPRAGFASLEEFARAVHRSHPQTPSGSVDQRLLAMYAAPAGYMREGASNDGYMVPPEFRDRIWERVLAGDNLISEIDSEPTNSNQVNDLTDDTTPWGTTGVKAFWRAEASQMTATRPSVTPRSVILHELYAFVTATDELIEDAPRLNARLDVKASEAIGYKLDDGIIDGDGVGKPLGWNKSPAMITVAKESGQAADSLAPMNIAKMLSRMLPEAVARSHWRMNSDVVPQLMTMTLDGNLLWTPPQSGFQGAPGGFLLGRPIRFSEHSPTLGDKGDVQLVDPKGYYGLTKAGGVKFASSIHLYFDYGLQAFRWTVRFGGQPHLRAPVSPKNGTTTKSHFVQLAERA